MKALSLLVRKLWPRLKFFSKVGQSSRSRSELMVPSERSCHKQYTCAIWKPHLLLLESYGQDLKFLNVHTHTSTPKVGLWQKLPGHSYWLAKNCSAKRMDIITELTAHIQNNGGICLALYTCISHSNEELKDKRSFNSDSLHGTCTFKLRFFLYLTYNFLKQFSSNIRNILIQET